MAANEPQASEPRERRGRTRLMPTRTQQVGLLSRLTVLAIYVVRARHRPG